MLIPTRWFDDAAYHDPRYDPVWSACEEAELVLHTHSGAGPSDYDLGPGFVSIYAAEAVVGGPAAGCCCCPACSSATPGSSTRSPRTAPTGCPT